MLVISRFSTESTQWSLRTKQASSSDSLSVATRECTGRGTVALTKSRLPCDAIKRATRTLRKTHYTRTARRAHAPNKLIVVPWAVPHELFEVPSSSPDTDTETILEHESENSGRKPHGARGTTISCWVHVNGWQCACDGHCAGCALPIWLSNKVSGFFSARYCAASGALVRRFRERVGWGRWICTCSLKVPFLTFFSPTSFERM